MPTTRRGDPCSTTDTRSATAAHAPRRTGPRISTDCPRCHRRARCRDLLPLTPLGALIPLSRPAPTPLIPTYLMVARTAPVPPHALAQPQALAPLHPPALRQALARPHPLALPHPLAVPHRLAGPHRLTRPLAPPRQPRARPAGARCPRHSYGWVRWGPWWRLRPRRRSTSPSSEGLPSPARHARVRGSPAHGSAARS